MPSLLLENITPPIVVSFSSHGSQFKFREWCETEPTIFRSYPRDKNVRPFITDLNQRQKNSSQLFQDRGGLVPRRVLNPGLPLWWVEVNTSLHVFKQWLSFSIVIKRSFALQISNTVFLVLLVDHPSSPYSSFHGADCCRKLQTTAHNPPHVEIVVSSHPRSSSYQHSWARSPDCWGRGGW